MAQASFPQSKQGGYDIHSKPIFLLVGQDSEGNKWTEVLVMEADMHVTAEDPGVSHKTGRREVSLTIDSWRAEGFSNRLNTPIVMELDRTHQKTDEEGDMRSAVIAKSSATDFPAQLVFNMAYTIEAPAMQFKTSSVLRSTAAGTITEFPPAPEDQFAISGKEITVAGIDVHALMCAC